jgi:glycosyltransferase involved in cell wall biosynthesis
VRGRRHRPRVLIIVQNLPVPFDRRVWLEATTLAGNGFDVTCICPKARGFDRGHEVLEGVRILRYRLPGEATGALGFAFEFAWCFLRTAMLTGRVALRRGIDVVHFCNPPETFFPLGWIVRAFGRRVVFDHHDLSPEMYDAKFGDDASPRVRRALERLERETFRVAHVVIATNESHREVAVERGGVDADDIYVVRSGPDLRRLERTEPRTSWRRGKRHLLVYLGEMCEQDGVDHLIRALAHLRDLHGRDDVHCVFVGGGPHQPALEAYATEIGVDDMTTFTGRVSDEVLCEILSSADIGIDPDPLTPWSDRSTMNKIMEYLYFELPVVSYELTEAKVSAGPAALFVTPNDEQALAKGILELLDDPERRAEMGRIGRRRIEERLSWEHSVPSLLEAYGRVT